MKANRELNFAILKNELNHPSENWQKACEKYEINYKIIDLTKSEWLKNCTSYKFDYYLTCPSGTTSIFKRMYDERIYILDRVLNLKLYPNYNEIFIHENKRMTYYWLLSKNLPCLNTRIIYKKSEAHNLINNIDYPLVAKSSVGSTSAGVFIIKDKKEFEKYIENIFSKGVRRKVGPNFRQGNYIKRSLHALMNPKNMFRKIMQYKSAYHDLQKGFLILQNYIEHDFEWRAVKIGNSYFAYKKLKVGDFCSGSKNFWYGNVPESILNLTKKICEIENFNTMAIDCFENSEGIYFINELQTAFGHENPFLTRVNNKSGRYLCENNQWVFEEGDFNGNQSYDLRLENILEILNNK